MNEIKKREELTELLNNNKYVILKIFATWCGPCKMLMPLLESTSKEVDGVTFTKFDIEQDKNIATEFGVRNIPALIFLKNGQEVFRHGGVISKKDLLTKVEELTKS